MAMKRGYSAIQFKSTIRKLRAIRPDISISSDFIVGFPGETDADFDKLMELIHEIGFDNSFSFIFSPRPGTPAANLQDDTSHEVKLKRLQHLQATIEANAQKIAQSKLGTVQRVLVEKTGNGEGQLMGRTECNRLVSFAGNPRLMGQLADVTITEAKAYSFKGEIVTSQSVIANEVAV
jgi:tRNA-2-methylthio-N6-dimethylallyladenosine synthase